jgi:transcriptional antiterminator RfaH
MPDLTESSLGWYCFKALPKKEHIAAELLRKMEGLDTLCPRIAYMKQTKRGKVRFVECLFPGYVFVRADLSTLYRRIRSIQGIRDVVAFGDRIPSIPDAFVTELRLRIGEESIAVLPDAEITPGQEVTITEGPFRDWKAVVTGEMDSHQRVALLLEFLGRHMEIQMRVEDLLPDTGPPKGKIWEE